MDKTSGGGSFFVFTTMPSWIISTIVHAIILLLLALFTFQVPVEPKPANVLVLSNTADVALDLAEFHTDSAVDTELTTDADSETPAQTFADDLVSTSAPSLTAMPTSASLDSLGATSLLPGTTGSWSGPVGGGTGAAALAGRSSARKGRLLKEAGGTPGSEAAVSHGLKWLSEHQLPNGSWSLDHRHGPKCQGQCSSPGTRQNAPFGATALALLPFLGSGHTHMEGDYKDVVDRGLAFLLTNARVEGDRASLFDPGGNYYSHGLGTMAICEAYALTKDRRLAGPAQALLNEIAYVQEPLGGGWRYKPRQVGDTSVLGWQFMAMKSGHLAGLRVPATTIQRASHFLDSVASEDQSRYRYMVRPEGSDDVDPSRPSRFRYPRSTTSVALLCRMYSGWSRDDPRVQQGVEWLSRQGPSIARGKPEIYYDYHATQVMRHFGGEPWDLWNRQIRDALIALQSTDGHEAGSWYFANENRSLHQTGGRTYCTSLAVMILEVYYRHLPIFQASAVDDEFPL